MAATSLDMRRESATRARTLRALNVMSHIDLKSGGICATVPGFSRALMATGNWESATAAFAHEDEISHFQEGDGDVLRLPRGWGKSRQQLRERIEWADVVHIHGLWEEHCAVSAALCRKLSKPYVISSHGMLDPWAVRNKRWKKAVYTALIERRNLRGAACVRAVTAAETEDYRRFGIEVPCAVLPLGCDTPPALDASSFLSKFPGLAGRPLVLFLGRLHYKKGLDVLCRSWAELTARYPEARLVLAGPESADTQQTLLKLIADLKVGSSVVLTGMLDGEMKWSALAASSVFVLPSYSENFAVAASEAMLAGVPAIVTRQCNRPEVAESGAGWVIEPNQQQLTAAIDVALAMTDEQRNAMGARGRRLVEDRYSWDAIGVETAAVYEWILGFSQRPKCVYGGRT